MNADVINSYRKSVTRDIITRHSAKVRGFARGTVTLYRSGQITALERVELISAMVLERQSHSKATMKAKLREIERYVGGRKASPVARGGLPSLGKRRPGGWQRKRAMHRARWAGRCRSYGMSRDTYSAVEVKPQPACQANRVPTRRSSEERLSPPGSCY
jgi:hypothetical protein